MFAGSCARLGSTVMFAGRATLVASRVSTYSRCPSGETGAETSRSLKPL